MKILLVNPPANRHSLGYWGIPLGLLYLVSAVTAAGHEAQWIDGVVFGEDGILQKVKNYEPDIVGISILTPGRFSSLRIAALTKMVRPQARVILGGAHATIMHDQLMQYSFVDEVCMGEGEGYLDSLLRWGRPECGYATDLDKLSWPAWHTVEFGRYPRIHGKFTVPIVFSRGCVGRCAFCSAFWVAGKYRVRSPQDVAHEINYLKTEYGLRDFGYIDDTFSANRSKTYELCERLIDHKITWQATTRTDCVDRELLSVMRRSGCRELSFGIESASGKILESINKGPQEEEAIRWTKEAGIKVNALLMVGNPGESEETIAETLAFLKKTKPDKLGCVGGVWVLPGTALYQRAKREGLMEDSFWLSDQPLMTYPAADPDRLERWTDTLYSYDRYRNLRHRIGKLIR